MQNQFNGGKVVFSTNGTGVIDHPQAQKERERTLTYICTKFIQPIQKLTQSGLQT